MTITEAEEIVERFISSVPDWVVNLKFEACPKCGVLPENLVALRNAIIVLYR